MNDMNDLNELFSLLAKEKKVAKEKENIIKENISKDLNSLFTELSSLNSSKKVETLVEVKPLPTPVGEVPPAAQSPAVANLPNIDKYLKSPQFQNTPEISVSDKELKQINQKLKFLEQWIGKINNAGPGSGEVNLRYLDDVDRPTIYDMRFLRYNDAKKKFEFAEVNPHDIVYTTHLVTTSTYTVDSDDYYVGVNYAGPCTITLPTTSLSSGRSIVIKDESGAAETNPITVVGTVDNDAGGFIIQINNGATQLIYRDGWRIV